MIWDYQSILANWPVIWRGLVGTMHMGFVCIAMSMSIGLVVGSARYSRSLVFRIPATAFVEFFRNTPVLVQIIWFFFAFPVFTGIKITPFWAGVLGVSLNGAAYCAEIFRGGIQNIARGQWEACRALGMNYRQTMGRVILPQAIKRMLPPLTNRAVEMIKATAIASIIAYYELLHSARIISSNFFNPIESYTAVAIVFIVVIWPLTYTTRLMEKRLSVSD